MNRLHSASSARDSTSSPLSSKQPNTELPAPSITAENANSLAITRTSARARANADYADNNMRQKSTTATLENQDATRGEDANIPP